MIKEILRILGDLEEKSLKIPENLVLQLLRGGRIPFGKSREGIEEIFGKTFFPMQRSAWDCRTGRGCGRIRSRYPRGTASSAFLPSRPQRWLAGIIATSRARPGPRTRPAGLHGGTIAHQVPATDRACRFAHQGAVHPAEYVQTMQSSVLRMQTPPL